MRYAIYHLPEGALGQWGASWLGWDIRSATAAGAVDLPPLPRPRDELTQVPRRYGFHATMKAPMHLAPGSSVDELRQALAGIAQSQPAFTMEMALKWDWGFLALRPIDPPAALGALEAALVTGLDRFRAPLTPQDRARRHPERLSERACAHLDQWGYPHVLDLFHYHLTLTGHVSPEESAALADALAPSLAPLIAQPMPVTRIALVAEATDRHFHLIEEFPLLGASG